MFSSDFYQFQKIKILNNENHLPMVIDKFSSNKWQTYSILAIVNKFVGIPSSYNCQNLLSLNWHSYEKICHSTNWGDIPSSKWKCSFMYFVFSWKWWNLKGPWKDYIAQDLSCRLSWLFLFMPQTFRKLFLLTSQPTDNKFKHNKHLI